MDVVAREKRGLDSASAEEGQPDRKRPALARFSFSTASFLVSRFCFTGLDSLVLQHCYETALDSAFDFV